MERNNRDPIQIFSEQRIQREIRKTDVRPVILLLNKRSKVGNHEPILLYFFLGNKWQNGYIGENCENNPRPHRKHSKIEGRQQKKKLCLDHDTIPVYSFGFLTNFAFTLWIVWIERPCEINTHSNHCHKMKLLLRNRSPQMRILFPQNGNLNSKLPIINKSNLNSNPSDRVLNENGQIQRLGWPTNTIVSVHGEIMSISVLMK